MNVAPSIMDPMESDEPSAYERAMEEIERRSKVCAEAAAGNWGGRADAENDESARPD